MLEKVKQKKTTILTLIVILLLVTVSILGIKLIVSQANLARTINDRAYGAPTAEIAEREANKLSEQNTALQNKVNSYEQNGVTTSVYKGLPEFTALAEKKLKQQLTDFYNFDGNATKQRAIIDHQNTVVQPYFETELAALKTQPTHVDQVDCAYQVNNKRLQAIAVVKAEVTSHQQQNKNQTAVFTWQITLDPKTGNILAVDSVFKQIKAG